MENEPKVHRRGEYFSTGPAWDEHVDEYIALLSKLAGGTHVEGWGTETDGAAATESLKRLQQRLAEGRRSFKGSVDTRDINEDLIGFALVGSEGEGEFEVFAVWVKDAWRRRGVGSELMQEALKQASYEHGGGSSVVAKVHPGGPLERICARLGFRREGDRMIRSVDAPPEWFVELGETPE